MELGSFLIGVAFLASLLSAWYFHASAREAGAKKGRRKKKNAAGDGAQRWARISFHVMTLLVLMASAHLFYLLLTHRFDVTYVYRYTATDLPLGYLISAFWAGQQGSFLLWALLIALMGELFLRVKNPLRAQAMMFVSLFQAFFLLILLKATPFAVQAHPPAEGAGLNPLLQNPWMVIHPPMLFIGYAAATFPAAIVLAALLRRQFDQWAKLAFPWTLLTSVTLGAGIILGGYWAYGVLGWGGYWGWDPVENSSLIVWIVVMALFHGLILTRRSGAMQRSNFILAILSLVLVLYATFLTRSGVLADFSVHSFQDLGINAYLIVGMLSVFIAGFGLLFKRLGEIPRVAMDWTGVNRENALVLAIMVLLASAFFVLLGTSSPILTTLVGNPSQVDISFYNQVNLPIAIVMSLLLGVTPFLLWQKASLKSQLSRWGLSALLAAVTTAVAVVLGLRGTNLTVFFALAAWGLWSNGISMFLMSRTGWLYTGAPMAHVGVALLFMSIVVSGSRDRKEQVALIRDVPIQALGYELTYRGVTPKANGKDVMEIDVAGQGTAYRAAPRLYLNSMSKDMMREPDIKAGAIRDIYISPLTRPQGQRLGNRQSLGTGQTVSLAKGERKSLEHFDVLFTDFEMDNHAANGAFRVGASLEIHQGGRTHVVTPVIEMQANNQNTAVPAALDFMGNGSSGATVRLAGINADAKKVDLIFEGLDGAETEYSPLQDQLVVEISEKPLMSALWLACLLILAGTLIAIRRRQQELE